MYKKIIAIVTVSLVGALMEATGKAPAHETDVTHKRYELKDLPETKIPASKSASGTQSKTTDVQKARTKWIYILCAIIVASTASIILARRHVSGIHSPNFVVVTVTIAVLLMGATILSLCDRKEKSGNGASSEISPDAHTSATAEAVEIPETDHTSKGEGAPENRALGGIPPNAHPDCSTSIRPCLPRSPGPDQGPTDKTTLAAQTEEDPIASIETDDEAEASVDAREAAASAAASAEAAASAGRAAADAAAQAAEEMKSIVGKILGWAKKAERDLTLSDKKTQNLCEAWRFETKVARRVDGLAAEAAAAAADAERLSEAVTEAAAAQAIEAAKAADSAARKAVAAVEGAKVRRRKYEHHVSRHMFAGKNKLGPKHEPKCKLE